MTRSSHPTTSASSAQPTIERQRAFATMTTLEVGGPASEIAHVTSEAALRELLADARSRRLPVFVLGGGSNLLVADRGFDGLVVRYDDTALSFEDGDASAGSVRVRAGAGLEWNELVAASVDAGLAGLECLAGIPGRVGAAPIQNIGAYGQEVAQTIESVEVVERASGAPRRLTAAECAFGYRSSRFKTDWRDRFVITAVRLRLRRCATGTVRYAELRRALDLGTDDPSPPLAAVRDAVLTLRRGKSMVLDPDDPNRRSAGSFFVNPVVDPARADAVEEAARARGSTRTMPRYPADGRDSGHVKLSAAWLIEEAGFTRGFRQGRAALSSRHTLALINTGGATSAELVALARTVRRGVLDAFGVTLEPEPTFLGFGQPVHVLLGPEPSESR
ncbi:MAG: UDP-N-acetylmuramate dehydrogenase [Acidobacteriota bacterium]